LAADVEPQLSRPITILVRNVHVLSWAGATRRLASLGMALPDLAGTTRWTVTENGRFLMASPLT
jgi:hypothetical protein